jgi:hypothetical protein
VKLRTLSSLTSYGLEPYRHVWVKPFHLMKKEVEQVLNTKIIGGKKPAVAMDMETKKCALIQNKILAKL